MVSIKYADSVQSKISLLEAANGAGLFIGPIFGGLIYEATSFVVPFFICGSIFLTFPYLMRKTMTPDLDRDDSAENGSKRISYIELLKHRRVLFAGLGQFFNILTFTIGQPIFGPRLTGSYHFSKAIVGV